MRSELPLSALLAQALAAFTLEFEHAVAEAGFPDLSLALGSNVLRFLGDEPMRVGAIASLAGVSKQAVSQQVAYLERRGYLEIRPDPADSRAKLVHLTDRGRLSQEVCRPLLGAVEERWRRRYGRAEIRDLRAALKAVVSKLDRPLPHYPAR